MPERIDSLQERCALILAMERRGFPPSEADQRLLDTLAQVEERQRHLEHLREAARQARLAVARPSRPPHPSPGEAPLSPAGAGGAVFDGRSGSGADYRARLQQLGLTTAFHEDRVAPPRPRLSPVVAVSQRRLEDEQAAQRAAAAARLAEGAVDGRSAPAKDVAARMRSLGIDPLLVGAVREVGKPLPPPSFPVNGRRGR